MIAQIKNERERSRHTHWVSCVPSTSPLEALKGNCCLSDVGNIRYSFGVFDRTGSRVSRQGLTQPRPETTSALCRWPGHCGVNYGRTHYVTKRVRSSTGCQAQREHKSERLNYLHHGGADSRSYAAGYQSACGAWEPNRDRDRRAQVCVAERSREVQTEHRRTAKTTNLGALTQDRKPYILAPNVFPRRLVADRRSAKEEGRTKALCGLRSPEFHAREWLSVSRTTVHRSAHATRPKLAVRGSYLRQLRQHGLDQSRLNRTCQSLGWPVRNSRRAKNLDASGQVDGRRETTDSRRSHSADARSRCARLDAASV